MNKILLPVFLIAILATNYAQAQMYFGVRMGANVSQLVGAVPIKLPPNVSGVRVNQGLKPGVQIGILGEFGTSGAFALQSGLLLNVVGSKFNIQSNNVSYTAIWNTTYLQIPLDFMLKFGNFFIHAGPYFSYGLRGRANYDFIRGNIDLFEAIDKGGWSKQQLCYGARAGIGMQFGSSQIGLTYGLGVVNKFNPDDFRGIKSNHNLIDARNHVISITASHFFGKEKTKEKTN
jgi:hypothetical protein